MESKTITMTNTSGARYNIKHKEGYYLISEVRVSEKGEEWEASCKTYPDAKQAIKKLVYYGYSEVDAEKACADVQQDYWNKVSADWLKMKAKKEKVDE